MSQGTAKRGTSGGVSEARARLLGTATKIFYAEGIHSVGVDRIIAEAQVTRATLYRHFTGKEELVLAYLGVADEGIRAQVAKAREGAGSPADEVRAVAGAIADGIRSPGFRGAPSSTRWRSTRIRRTRSTRRCWPTGSGSWRR